MSRRFVAAVIVLVAGLALPAAAQSPLKWKFKKGDQLYLRNTTTTKQTLKALKVETTRNSSVQTVVLGFTVVDVAADESVLLKETIEEVTIKPEKGQQSTESAIAGASFTIDISPKGEIRKFDGYKELVAQLAGEDQTVRQALLATIQEDALKKTVRELFLFLPDTPAKEGMKWEQSVEGPFGALGTLRETRKYQLAGKAERGGKMVDKITFTTDVTYSTEGKKVGDHSYYVIEGKVVADPKNSTGTILFDSSSGRVVEVKSDMKLKGTFAMSISETRVDVETEQEQSTTIEILTEKPKKGGTGGVEQ
jgi:hypothetical protein